MKNKTNITPAALSASRSGNLENFIAATTPGGIEAQEKRGQIEQSFSETLPVDGTSTEEQRKQFEALGFVFALDRTAAQKQGRDEIFVAVTFPKGWRKQATSHSMWSNLLDDKGRKRGAIFYKAAFYDRSASVHLLNRYGVSRTTLDSKQEEIFDRSTGEYRDGKRDAKHEYDRMCVLDSATNEDAFTMEPIPCPDWSNREQAMKLDSQSKEASEACVQWLSVNKPDWKSPLAYWD